MKRFYREVTTAPADGGWRVLLDGRPIRTQGGRPQLVPGAALAEALAAEWAAQPAEIDPAGFVFRDMADHALDIVAPDRDAAIATLVGYAGTDTLCYRDEPGSALWRRQEARWEPILTATEAELGVDFVRVAGIMHRPQPEATLARMAEDLAARDDFALAALTQLTSLAASLVIGRAALAGDADALLAETLWDAANLEEDWQAEIWGTDAEAAERRERRRGSFLAAARFAALARNG